ncbi:MAG: amino acid ABC transporter substrate-binding protein [Egibacteraceae bacterium]
MSSARDKLGRWLCIVVTVALAGACAPQQAPEQASGGETEETPEEIVVGSTLPLTGAESRAGGLFKEGYELAVAEVNDAGGVQVGDQQVPVRLELLDDTSTQGNTVNLAERLITQDGVDFLLGTYSTALVEAQSTVAEQNQVPYVNGGGAATSIYARGYQWVFGNLAPVELLATNEMEWIAQEQEAGNLSEPAKIAILWENTSHGEDFRKGINDFVEQSDGAYEVVVDESFELESRDFSAVLNQVRSADADLFMVDAHLPDYITMHRQYLQAGMCHEVITYGARGTESDAREALGEKNTDNILSAVWWNAQLGSEGLNKTFVESFQAEYDREPEWYHAVAYEAARALFTAITEAGSTDRAAVRDALASLEMESILPGGMLSFPEDSGFQAQYPFVVQQNQGAESPIIYPEDVATAEGRAPNPSCEQ